MRYRTSTSAPTAKVRAAGSTLALGALLPLLNVLLAHFGLPALEAGDLDAAGGLVAGAYTAAVAAVALVRAYLRRPDAGDGPVPDVAPRP